MARSAAAATARTPLAWLRMELGTMDYADLRLKVWPGDEDRNLARAHWHGKWVEWLD